MEKFPYFLRFSCKETSFPFMCCSYNGVGLDLAEARRLISEAGYRPYVRKVRGREYISLNRGSREVGVGPFSQDVWDSCSLSGPWLFTVRKPMLARL